MGPGGHVIACCQAVKQARHEPNPGLGERNIPIFKGEASPINDEGTAVNGLSIAPHAIGIDLGLLQAKELRRFLDLEQPDQEPDTQDGDLEGQQGVESWLHHFGAVLDPLSAWTLQKGKLLQKVQVSKKRATRATSAFVQV